MNLIETKQLSFRIGHKIILDNINIQIPKNSIYALVGRNGAGKTTLFKLLLGLMAPTYGSIYFDGQTLNPMNRVSILQKIGTLIENASIYEHLNAYQNISLLRYIYNFPKNRIEEVLEIVGLKKDMFQKTKTFSLGMKQRLGLAMAMVAQPKILFLDEPTNGLDPMGVVELRKVILDLHQNHQVTIIVTSHILSELEKISSHVGILEKGKILIQAPKTEILQEKSLEDVYLEMIVN